jgi:hypothetical protein
VPGKGFETDMGGNVTIIDVLTLSDLVDKLLPRLSIAKPHKRNHGDGQRNPGFRLEDAVLVPNGFDDVVKVACCGVG